MGDRIVYLDYARSFALFLVVFAHLYSADSDVKQYVYAFHMPFFFFVSGYLHKDDDMSQLVKKMAKRMLVPFCFFLFIGFLFHAMLRQGFPMGVLKGSIKGMVLGTVIKANDILWFLLALFFTRIIGNAFIKRVWLGLLFVLLLVILTWNYNIFYLGSSLMALPFFLCGYYGKEYLTILFQNKKLCVFIGLACALCSFIISNINGKVSMAGRCFGNTPNEWINFSLFYLNGIMGTLMLLCVSSFLRKESKIVNIVSKSSISIVGLQYIPIIIWMKTVGLNQSYIFSFSYSILIIAIAVFFHYLVQKKSNWLLGGK